MKDLKNKDVILGLIVLIILCMIAIVLIIKREFPEEINKEIEAVPIAMEETVKTETAVGSDTSAIMSGGYDMGEPQLQEELKQEEAAQMDTAEEKEKVQLAKEEVLLEQNKMESLGLGSSTMQAKEFAEPPVYKEYTGEDMWQLEELYAYWKDYQLEAVDDLIRLPRVRTMTNELSDTSRFYYYGEKNSDGLPHGSGLAVYADNAYYCGEWKNGKRHGNGMWLQIFPDKTVIMNGVPGVTEHSYNGQWQNDYPNGEGQEHISYNEEEMDGEYMITNVIGGFKDGYYNDSLYIMAFDKGGGTTDWEATAKKGAFNYYHERYNASGECPVWKEMKESEEDVFRWLDEPENVNWGISGLKKMN